MKAKAILTASLFAAGLLGTPQCVEAHETSVMAEQPDSVYEVVDELAKFPGGDEAMWVYIQKHLTYPEEMLQQRKSGRVFVSFVVTKKGTIRDVTIKKTPDEGFNETVIQIIKGMPKWKPAKVKGKKVSFRMALPIMFNLAN